MCEWPRPTDHEWLESLACSKQCFDKVPKIMEVSNSEARFQEKGAARLAGRKNVIATFFVNYFC